MDTLTQIVAEISYGSRVACPAPARPSLSLSGSGSWLSGYFMPPGAAG